MDNSTSSQAGPPIHAELVSFYTNLLPKPNTTICMFDRGDFHSLIGHDALYVATEILHRATQQIKGSDGKALEYVNLNRTQFESVIRELLLVHFYRVEIYDCKTWKLAYKGSPGNVSQFEEVLFGGSQGSNQTFGVAAISVTLRNNERIVALAIGDDTMRNFTISEIVDNDRYSNLEACLIQLSPKECVIQSGTATPPAVRELLSNLNILITETKKADFSCSDITQDLEKLLKLPSRSTVESLGAIDKKLAMGCLTSVIKYLELLSQEDSFKSYKLTTFDMSQYMKLDHSAVSALNLIPLGRDSREQSLFGVLNNCKTVQGQRLLRQWIKQPLTDVLKINERLDLVEIFVENSLLRSSIATEHLQALPDYSKLAKRLTTNRASLQDCYRIYQSLKRLPALDECLDEYSGSHVHILSHAIKAPIKELTMDLMKFSDMIEEVLDMSTVDSLEFLVRPDFDENLGVIGANLKQLEQSMTKQLNKAAIDLGVETHKVLKLDSSTVHGHAFRFTRKDEKLLRNNKNYEILDTKKDGVRFTNRSLSALNREYQEQKHDYQTLQKSVVFEIMKIACGYTEPLFRLSDVIAELDVYISMATASDVAPIPYVRPTLHVAGSGKLILSELRHPCLELMDAEYIPNTIEFEKKGSMFHIITGPNMGGKSTYIRSVGMAVLMAQIGCFVACSSAHVTIVDSIMARVGASDNQVKGVSTFMAEMSESSRILKAATCDSLVIIDELGRGTSTYDGFGLAWAIAHYVASNIGCFGLFATHFHELTALADEIPSVNNLHVTALTLDDKLTLLYQVHPGVCDQSFGLHVARMVRFPDHVLSHAKMKAKQLEDAVISPKVSGEYKEDLKRQKCESYNVYKSLIKRMKSSCHSNSSDEQISKAIDEIRDSVRESDNFYVRSITSE